MIFCERLNYDWKLNIIMAKPALHYPDKSPAQAMVEFALVLPILLLIIYGLIEVGRLLFIYNSVYSAARQAARYGATTGLNVEGGVPRYQDCNGIRSAAQKSGFLEKFEEVDILIWHDDGEAQNQVSYCVPGKTVDRSFHPSIGNSSRVKVQVNAEYAPILSFIPLQPLTISSISARTILVSVPVYAGDQSPTYEPEESAVSPTKANSSNTHPGAPKTAKCDVRHGILKTSPFGMTIYNYNVATTVHIQEIEIWAPPSSSEQTVTRLNLGGVNFWEGAMESDSPSFFDAFFSDVSIGPRANKFLQVILSKNYRADGSERIVVNFEEKECPNLDTSNNRQLP
jgi:hypothetical protein